MMRAVQSAESKLVHAQVTTHGQHIDPVKSACCVTNRSLSLLRCLSGLHAMLRVGSTEISLERSHLSSQRTALERSQAWELPSADPVSMKCLLLCSVRSRYLASVLT